jgi:hypothetical protein
MDTDLGTPALLNYQPRAILDGEQTLELISLDSANRNVHQFRLTPQTEFRFIDDGGPELGAG